MVAFSDLLEKMIFFFENEHLTISIFGITKIPYKKYFYGILLCYFWSTLVCIHTNRCVNMSGTDDIMFINVVVIMFKLVCSNFTYIIYYHVTKVTMIK
jgi:uncharacterized membrane protein YdjX (TVP38/TMEM64 family)